MRWILTALGLFCSITFAQSPELEQAIQVVRNWLGDPNAPVQFRFAEDYNVDLGGPENNFVFKTPGYRQIVVDLNTMTVVGWLRDYEPQPGPSLLSDEQVKNIALNYARKHCPYFDTFEHYEIKLYKYRNVMNKNILDYVVTISPFFINNQGQKIPCLAIGCGVHIDPYTGKIYGFGYRYLPMTVTNLTPSFSADEAKEKIEQAFRNLGAAQAVAVMSDPSDPIFKAAPDGLVLGATQTSGMRLAYAFDYVVTVGSPGHEDEFGDAEHPAMWRAAIDAHTGELFYREYWLGEAGEKEKQLLRQRATRESSIRAVKVTELMSLAGLLFLALTCVSLLIFRRLQRRVAS